jgi:hypothetical protein
VYNPPSLPLDPVTRAAAMADQDGADDEVEAEVVVNTGDVTPLTAAAR